MNLRGTVVPVVNLRTKLTMPEVEPSAFTVIIMVRIGSKATGLLVDAVSDVLAIPDTSIEAPPDFGATVDSAFVKGTARVGEKLIVLLDIDRVLAADEAIPREVLS
jgi:purine-binding chemotaxis protein CheW